MKNKGREETVEVIDFSAEERILNSEPVKRKQEAFFLILKSMVVVRGQDLILEELL